MSAIFIDGHLAHYEVIGRGKPVLFLHGWVGSWRYWVPTMQVISTSNRAYALDFWGFGDSAKSHLYSIKEQTEFVSSFIEKIGIYQFSIVGHGLGAIIAFALANLLPEQVEKVMSISNPLLFDMINSRFFAGDHVGLVEKLVGKGIETEAVRSDEPKNDPIAIKQSINELQEMDQYSLVRSFGKTGLLVYGQNDPVIRTPTLEIIHNFNPEIHTIYFEESGHFPMLDESSKFSRLLSEFLELSEEDVSRNLQIKEKWQRRVR